VKRMMLTTLGAALVVGCLSVPAGAGIHISIPIEIVATDTPVYYNGYASYWYGDRWYYRNRGVWYEYRTEPRYLRDYREHHRHERRFYGRREDRWERRERWEDRRERWEERRERREERERERERRHRRHHD
jgi:hypothetical protein